MAEIVQVVKHEKRCKICSSPQAETLNGLLLLRSQRGKDAEGKVVNLDYVLAAMSEAGIENPTLDNVKGHWKNHVRVISDEQAQEEAAAFEAAVGALADGSFDFEDVDEGLRFFFSLGVKELRRKVAAGESVGISHDHLLKAAGEITKRRSNDAQNELMKALGGGIQQVFTKALGGEPEQPQIEEAVEVAEFTEVEAA